MIFDPAYLLFVFLPAMILSIAAQVYVRSSFNKWSNVRNGANLTGTEIARRILARTSVGNVSFEQPRVRGFQPAAAGVSLERTAGAFTDHYDPRTHTVRLSDATASTPSVAAMAVVAHELGHAQQHEENSILIQMRNFLVPAVALSPQIAFGLIFIGLLFNLTGLMWLGIMFFGLLVVFAVLTLPVEFDASRRGLNLLRDAGLFVTEEDQRGSRAVLTAAAMTYVAAAVTAILQLLYYISLAQRRD
ncbi:MAG TPA: zinc metallopeptidase [Spirillospora sp.]|nr:zinc metallopeptidase [Spirillospora sp.]